jgi:hypothetical protein
VKAQWIVETPERGIDTVEATRRGIVVTCPQVLHSDTRVEFVRPNKATTSAYRTRGAEELGSGVVDREGLVSVEREELLDGSGPGR